MTLTIKRNHDGDPVCADCGHYFGIGVKAMEVDEQEKRESVEAWMKEVMRMREDLQ